MSKISAFKTRDKRIKEDRDKVCLNLIKEFKKTDSKNLEEAEKSKKICLI